MNGATSDVQFSDELMSNGTFLADKHPMTSCVVVALLEEARNRRQREVVFLGQRIVRGDCRYFESTAYVCIKGRKTTK